MSEQSAAKSLLRRDVIKSTPFSYFLSSCILPHPPRTCLRLRAFQLTNSKRSYTSAAAFPQSVPPQHCKCCGGRLESEAVNKRCAEGLVEAAERRRCDRSSWRFTSAAVMSPPPTPPWTQQGESAHTGTLDESRHEPGMHSVRAPKQHTFLPRVTLAAN